MYAHRRHDISDRVWENIQARLPGKKGNVGRPAGDNKLFINAVFCGYCGQERHGVICLLTLGTGKIPIAGIKVF